MAYYTSQVKTWTIDPTFHTRQRSEFRLPAESLFLPNLRLLNIGVYVNEAKNRYNFLVGSQCIKNIWIYNGKEVLDQVLGFGSLEAFRRYSRTNSENMDLAKVLKGHGMGFFLYTFGEANGEPLPHPQVCEWNPIAPNKPQTTDEASPRALIDLKEVFGLLNSIEFLSSKMFPELRVVIEYDTENVLALDVVENPSVVAGVCQPLLVADEFIDPAMHSKFLSEFKSVMFNSWETETVQLPANAVSSNFKLTGLCGKTVGRVLVQKQGATAYSKLYKNLGSEVMINETIQFVIDGRNWMPNDGISRPNEKLGILTDTFGVCNSIPLSNDTGCYRAPMVIQNYDDRIGHLDYTAIKVGQTVANVQLNYKREIPIGASVRYSQSLRLNVFGEVGKAIVKSPSVGYMVVYL